jgi:hypothetical protein
MCLRFLVCLASISLLIATEKVQADEVLVTITNMVNADFMFESTAAGQQIFGVPEGAQFPLRGTGSMNFQLVDDGSNLLNFTAANGQLAGVSPPTPPGFLPFYVTPIIFNGGTLSNVTRDGQGRITGGMVNDLAMVWEMIGTGANTGIVLYGDAQTTPLLFSGAITIEHDAAGVRFGTGDMIAGPLPFNVYLHQTGDRVNQIPGTDPLVFIGFDRTLTFSAIPEPSSMMTIGVALLVALGQRRRG